MFAYLNNRNSGKLENWIINSFRLIMNGQKHYDKKKQKKLACFTVCIDFSVLSVEVLSVGSFVRENVVLEDLDKVSGYSCQSNLVVFKIC